MSLRVEKADETQLDWHPNQRAPICSKGVNDAPKKDNKPSSSTGAEWKMVSANNTRRTKETAIKSSNSLDLAGTFHKEIGICASFCLKVFLVWLQTLFQSLHEQVCIHSSHKTELLVSKANPGDTHRVLLCMRPFIPCEPDLAVSKATAHWWSFGPLPRPGP